MRFLAFSVISVFSVSLKRPNVAKHRKSKTLMGFRLSVFRSQNTESRSQKSENPTPLLGFAFRCFLRKTPKVVRRTANIQRLYWASHFSVSCAKHRKSFAEQRTFNAFIGLRMSVFLSQTTKVVCITANIQRVRESANMLSG